MIYRRYVKRILDCAVALVILVVFLPIWLLIALAIVLDSPGDPLFRQERVGYRGVPFIMYKFRTMIPDAYKYGKGFYFDGEKDWRITRVGRILRKFSLDEVPQLLNVLLGSMSLVGPRPMLPYQYECLTDEQKRRFSVRPGITGLAQVSGRNILPWSERITLDIQYIEQTSFWLDLKILGKTFLASVSSRDMSYDVSRDQIEDFTPKGGSNA